MKSSVQILLSEKILCEKLFTHSNFSAARTRTVQQIFARCGGVRALHRTVPNFSHGAAPCKIFFARCSTVQKFFRTVQHRAKIFARCCTVRKYFARSRTVQIFFARCGTTRNPVVHIFHMSYAQIVVIFTSNIFQAKLALLSSLLSCANIQNTPLALKFN